MARYIDADDAIYELDRVFGVDDFKKIIRAISRTPTADVRENVHARWERHWSRPNVFADLFWHCSNCGYKNDNDYSPRYHHFCPNCGAYMIGEQNE